MRNKRLIALISISALVLAACGTQATPPYEATSTPVGFEEVAQAEDDEGEDLVEPAETEVPPTATEEPTATVEPTAEPTEEVAEEPTLEATEEETADTEEDVDTADSGDEAAGGEIDQALEDEIAFWVGLASASNGETLFNETREVADGSTWACSTCHDVQQNIQGVGPSLVGINERAGERVEGEGPLTYLYHSIYDSHAFIVPGFENNALQMPIYGETEILSDTQIYDLIAYLQTLPSE